MGHSPFIEGIGFIYQGQKQKCTVPFKQIGLVPFARISKRPPVLMGFSVFMGPAHVDCRGGRLERLRQLLARPDAASLRLDQKAEGWPLFRGCKRGRREVLLRFAWMLRLQLFAN